MGRTTKELYAMLGVLVMQQLHDMIDNDLKNCIGVRRESPHTHPKPFRT